TSGSCLRRGRRPARAVLDVRHQRRDGPAVPDAHPRPELHPPAVGGRDDAGPPDRRHHGDHGFIGSDHGRRRQVTVVGKSWNRLTLPGKIIFTALPVVLALFIVSVVGIVLLGGPVLDLLSHNL